jgi:hypothetical protein
LELVQLNRLTPSGAWHTVHPLTWTSSQFFLQTILLVLDSSVCSLPWPIDHAGPRFWIGPIGSLATTCHSSTSDSTLSAGA